MDRKSLSEEREEVDLENAVTIYINIMSLSQEMR